MKSVKTYFTELIIGFKHIKSSKKVKVYLYSWLSLLAMFAAIKTCFTLIKLQGLEQIQLVIIYFFGLLLSLFSVYIILRIYQKIKSGLQLYRLHGDAFEKMQRDIYSS